MRLGRAYKKGYKIFRGIWLVKDSIAFLSIILFIYTGKKALRGYVPQAYGWMIFIVFIGMVLSFLVKLIAIANCAKKCKQKSIYS